MIRRGRPEILDQWWVAAGPAWRSSSSAADSSSGRRAARRFDPKMDVRGRGGGSDDQPCAGRETLSVRYITPTRRGQCAEEGQLELGARSRHRRRNRARANHPRAGDPEAHPAAGGGQRRPLDFMAGTANPSETEMRAVRGKQITMICRIPNSLTRDEGGRPDFEALSIQAASAARRVASRVMEESGKPCEYAIRARVQRYIQEAFRRLGQRV